MEIQDAPRVPGEVFSTAHAKHGLDALRETYPGADITKSDGDASRHRYAATRYLVGGALVGYDSTESLTIDRTTRHLADGVDMYAMVFHLDGHSVHDDRVIKTGDLELQDFTEPYKAKFSNFRSVSLFLPRATLAPKLEVPEAGAIRRVPGESPLVKLAAKTLMNLHEALPHMTVDEANRAIHPVVDLCATAVNGHVESTLARNALESSLGTRARQFIEDELETPELSVEYVQRRFRCSRSHLYRVFPEAGGINAYIKNRRLRASVRRMSDPKYSKRTISEIAFELGFSSASVFGRAFKRRYGVSPRDARRAPAALAGYRSAQTNTLHDWFTLI